MKGIEIMLLAIGGLAGTFLRFKITQSHLLWGALPVNVLIANVIGSFVIGIFAVLSQQWNLDQKYAFFVAIGFCGTLTTMSSFVMETNNLLDNRSYLLAAVNILTNVGLSLSAVMGGKLLTSTILGWEFR